MADLVLTPASVLASSQSTQFMGTLGGTVTAGQPVYQDPADLDARGRGKWKLADANAASPAPAATAVALSGGASGQPATLCSADPDYTHGLAGVTAGAVIVISGTAGAFAPVADLASGMTPTVAMIATSATKAVLKFTNGLAAIPA